jgi:hypothetical protein
MKELYTQNPLVDSGLMNLSRGAAKHAGRTAAAGFEGSRLRDGQYGGLGCFADGGFPMFESGAGDNEAATVAEIGDFMLAEHIVDGFLADTQAFRDLGDCDCRMLFAIHGGNLRRHERDWLCKAASRFVAKPAEDERICSRPI